MTDAAMNKGPLTKLAWTRWECALVPTLPSKMKMAAKFVPFRNTKGYRLKSIFKDDIASPAFYEFAVQLSDKGASKKHVVYYVGNAGSRTKISWVDYFLDDKLVRNEIDLILQAGCSLWVRRGVAQGAAHMDKMYNMHKAKRYIDDNYDYAWNKYIWRKTGNSLKHRQLKVGRKRSTGIVISNDSF